MAEASGAFRVDVEHGGSPEFRVLLDRPLELSLRFPEVIRRVKDATHDLRHRPQCHDSLLNDQARRDNQDRRLWVQNTTLTLVLSGAKPPQLTRAPSRK